MLSPYAWESEIMGDAIIMFFHCYLSRAMGYSAKATGQSILWCHPSTFSFFSPMVSNTPLSPAEKQKNVCLSVLKCPKYLSFFFIIWCHPSVFLLGGIPWSLALHFPLQNNRRKLVCPCDMSEVLSFFIIWCSSWRVAWSSSSMDSFVLNSVMLTLSNLR